MVVASRYARISDLEYVPDGHSLHVADLPRDGLNVPGGHCMQLVCPATGWYHPAGHSMHVFWPTRNCTLPGGQGSHWH